MSPGERIVESANLPGRGDRAASHVLASFDGPAFLRRAHAVQAAYDAFLGRARKQRDEWLKMARTRLGLLQALASDWSALRPLLADDVQVAVLESLREALQPRLRARV